jgi:hypothetical protein
MLITVAARSKEWTVFVRSKAGIVGSNPTQGMDVCVCVYSVFVLSCVHVAALRRADDSFKETYSLCKNDYETEEEATAQQRAVEPLMARMDTRFTLECIMLAPATLLRNKGQQQPSNQGDTDSRVTRRSITQGADHSGRSV